MMTHRFPTIDLRACKRNLRQRFWYFVLRLIGWDLEGSLPDLPQYVLIAAPHTSGWDVIIGLIAKLSVPLSHLRWLAKDTVFWQPLGALLTVLGAIPVDRRRHHSYVAQMIAEFAQRDRLILALAPEGTRRQTDHWKSGFYYAALGAHVPIAAAFIDYGRKRIGVGPIFSPSGDADADMAMLAAFYGAVTARHPALVSDVRFLTDSHLPTQPPVRA